MLYITVKEDLEQASIIKYMEDRIEENSVYHSKEIPAKIKKEVYEDLIDNLRRDGRLQEYRPEEFVCLDEELVESIQDEHGICLVETDFLESEDE